MRGAIVFTAGGKQYRAELGDDLIWTSSDEGLALELNTRFEPQTSPALGAPGFVALQAAAAALGAKVVDLAQIKDEGDERVY